MRTNNKGKKYVAFLNEREGVAISTCKECFFVFFRFFVFVEFDIFFRTKQNIDTELTSIACICRRITTHLVCQRGVCWLSEAFPAHHSAVCPVDREEVSLNGGQ